MIKKAIKTLLLFNIIFYVKLSSAHNPPDYHFEGQTNYNAPYLFVSLGCTCWPAQALREHGLRDVAFPFDWLLTRNNEKFILCLNENFENFLNYSYFIRSPRTSIENTYYDFQFTHDWPFHDERDSQARYNEQLQFITAKYTRRINRFKNINDFQGKVFFIRCWQTDYNYKGKWGWNAKNTQDLNSALKKLFPNLNFTLVILSCTDPSISEIGDLPEIKEYKIANLTGENFIEYKSIFLDLIAEFEKQSSAKTT